MGKFRKIIVLSICCLGVGIFSASASDAEANDAARRAEEKIKGGRHSAAAQLYLDAVLLADDPVLKSNSLTAAARAFRNAKLYGREYECIERLLKEHISRVDFQRAVTREFQIADEYFAGHRDTIVSWLPFIHGEDRTIEIYEAALRNASCAPESADAKLRLGMLYLEKQKPEKAIELFKEVVSSHPGTDAARYANMELAYTYVQLSRRGDGDGAWTRLAVDTLSDFLKKYPNDPEAPWAKKAREEVRAIAAKREYGVGRYYHRIGRDDLAERYLARVIREHGTTVNSIESERLLAKIDKTYTPPAKNAPRDANYVHNYPRSAIPLERDPIMVVPENSDGKWLLPVRDLTPDNRLDSSEPLPERKFDDEDL